MTALRALDHEAMRVARALYEGRGLTAALGVPHESVEAGRALARWADAIGEHSLAIAAWDGCAALDETCTSWLGLADACLSASVLERAWDAAARVSVHPAASPDERAHAHLVLARVCLAIGKPNEARAHLLQVPSIGNAEHAALAKALAASLI
jgi:FimV-like protein